MRVPVYQIRISDPGVNVLVEREGMVLTAYQDSTGVWTIGMGHTSAAGPPTVTAGMTITEDQAWDIFWRDAQMFRDSARGLITAPLEQYEFDALASFIYNIGVTQFEDSTVLARVNGGDYAGAAEAILWWDLPPEIMDRRRGEYYEFKDGRYDARVDENGVAC